MKVVYDWIQEYVGEHMPSVEKLDELFTFHSFEIDGIEQTGKHTVIDVKVLPDRASDCLSHRGIAYELSTQIGVPLAYDPLRELVSLTPETDTLTVHIEDTHYCSRFACASITGVAVGPSPAWLVERLEALGQRSINNVVDATNYVMYALGQPLHAYDANRFGAKDGVFNFHVRMGRVGEEVVTLSGDTVALSPTVGVIANGHTDTPVGIAGIKGGISAQVTETTTHIILEAAHFDARTTRKASQAVRIQTDASKRFENNLSPELIPHALTACAALIREIAGGELLGYKDVSKTHTAQPEVRVTLTEIQTLLGIELTREEVRSIYDRLGFIYSESEEGVWMVTAPRVRTDITICEDVIAEIGRVYGYEHITAVPPLEMPVSEYNARHYYAEEIRRLLTEKGFSEVITSSFRKKDVITLANALASDKGCLRSTLRENIQETLNKNMPNADLLGLSQIRVFEIGTVFHKNSEGTDVAEHVSLALGIRTRQTGYTPKDDAAVKEVVTFIEQELKVPCIGTLEHGVFECNMNDLILHLPPPTLYTPHTETSNATFKPYSPYPFITRDIALWAPEDSAPIDIERILREKAGSLLVRLSLFDEFKKDNRISYAFRLIFQSMEQTLTDEEIGGIMDSIYTALGERGFETR